MSGEKLENGIEEKPNAKADEDTDTHDSHKTTTNEPIKSVPRTNTTSLDSNVQFKSISSAKPSAGKLSKQAPLASATSSVSARTSSSSGVCVSAPRTQPTLESALATSKATANDEKECNAAPLGAASQDQGSTWFDPRRIIKPDYEGTIKELKRRLNEATKDAHGWKTEATVWKKEAQTWKREFESAHAELNQMADQQEQQVEKFRRMQEKAFRQIDSAAWMPEANEDISRKLRTLDVDIKTWAKTYAVPLLTTIETTRDERTRLMDSLACVAKLENNKIPPRVGDDRAWMLLQARLLHKLYTDIFEEPFFFLGERLSNVKSSGIDRSASIAAEMSTLYEELRQVDEKGTFAWRAQTLRLLAPPSNPAHRAPKAAAETSQRTEEARDAAAVLVCDDFLLTGIEPLMTSPRCDAAEKALHTFAKRAAQIAYSLWVQKRDLQCKFMEDLPKTFQHGHALLEAHQLHNKHLNDNPARLDGLPILVVTHPAVVSRGNDDGDYNARSVLKKAICWMGEPPGWKH